MRRALAAWSRPGRRLAAVPTELRFVGCRSYGEDAGNGNLLGVQPWMQPSDYASREGLRAKLDGYLSEAKARGLVGGKTVVVFPEYLGVWLVAVGERRSVYVAETLTQAARGMAAGHPLSFLWQLLAARGPDRAVAALFAMKARAMADAYQSVFSQLARGYRVTIVAGSILLPDPEVRAGTVVAGRGPVYNVCAVYGADGRARDPLVRKAFPTEEERRYVAAGRHEDLPVFETPAGRLGVLICADSWYPDAYRVLREKGVEVIAAPSFIHRDGAWKQPWRGYSGAPPPDDVDEGEGSALSEGEAWMKYALPGRMVASEARAGMGVFLRGRMWGLGSDGEAMVVTCGKPETFAQGEGATIVSLWLPAR